jgi:hypothetical protein
VPPAAVTSLSDLRIEVRSTPQGVVQHKVAVGACHAGYAGPSCERAATGTR